MFGPGRQAGGCVLQKRHRVCVKRAMAGEYSRELSQKVFTGQCRLVEDTYGSDHLDLVLARGYVSKLITNTRVTRYLEMYHPEFLPEFEKITETEALAS